MLAGPWSAFFLVPHAPAASLASAKPGCGGGRPALCRRSAKRVVRAAIPPLPRPCPVTPPRSGTACARFTAASRCGAQGYTERAPGPGLVGHPSSRDPAPPPWSCRSPQPVGSHHARPFAFGGAPPFLCRHPLRAGEVRPGGRPWRWPPPGGPGPPVPRPARARVLARALADERRPGVASVLPAPETTPTRSELY